MSLKFRTMSNNSFTYITKSGRKIHIEEDDNNLKVSINSINEKSKNSCNCGDEKYPNPHSWFKCDICNKDLF